MSHTCFTMNFREEEWILRENYLGIRRRKMVKLGSAWMLVSIMVSGCLLGSSASAVEKSTCKRCGVGDYAINVIRERTVKDARVSINCIGGGLFFPQKCYEWRGNLLEGDNRIPLNRFTTEEGRWSIRPSFECGL